MHGEVESMAERAGDLRIYMNDGVTEGLVAEKDARISVFDHGYLYGDGVFEGIRAYHGRVFRLREHIDRLYRSARAIWLEIPVGREEMEGIVVSTAKANNLEDGYIRLVVSRGKGDLGLDPRKCPKATIVCIAASIDLYPAELYEQGMKIITVSTRRNRPDALNPNIKSLNYLNNIIAKIEVIQAGMFEGLMLNAEGYVAEGTGDNIFTYDGKTLCTPPVYDGILEGVTRAVVIELAREMGLCVQERTMTLLDVYTTNECFLTGTGAEIIPVIELDKRTIGTGVPGPVTRELITRFRALTKQEGVPIE